MGLDMWLYKVKKLDDEEVENLTGKMVDSTHNIFAISKENFEKNSILFTELHPYLRTIQMKTKKFNETRVKNDFGIPADAHIAFWGSCANGNLSISYNNGSEVEVSRESYTEIVEEEFLVSHMDEMRYWRKAYDIQEEIIEALDRTIENCGYYKLNEKACDYIGISYADGLFYHEWY